MCLKFGIEDPEQWLETVPARVFELWQAYYRLEPWGDERYMTSMLISLVSSLLASKCKEEDVHKVLLQPHELMPSDWFRQPEKKPESSIEQFQRELERKFG